MNTRKRDRVAAGIKAADTNLSKSPSFYKDIGSKGGKALAAAKRAFSRMPGLASFAAKRKTLINSTEYLYVVRSNIFKPESFYNRREARAHKRMLRNDYAAEGPITIKQYHFDDSGLLISEAFIR